MKFRWDKKYLYWGVTAFCVIAASIIFFLMLSQLSAFKGFLKMLISVSKPVIYGLVFAYLMNPILKVLERPAFVKWGMKICKEPQKAQRFSRGIGVSVTLIVTLLFLSVLLWMVLPKLYESVETLTSNVSTYFSMGRELIIATFPDGSEIESFFLNVLDSASKALNTWLTGDFLNELGTLILSISSGIFALAKEILNILVGFIVAVYVLLGKERFAAQGKKVLYSIFDTRRAGAILESLTETNKIFSGFISGKILDSVIIGILCYIILVIFKMPYKELVAVIVGVTNVIPFFGPFIGAVPSAFLILLVDPMSCLTFCIIILALQQFDGNILGPKILGDVTGLGSFWVICAILIGGGLFGFIGMLVGVPVFAIIYASIKKHVDQALKKKGVPVKTSEYKKIQYIDPHTDQPVYFSESEKKESAGNK